MYAPPEFKAMVATLLAIRSCETTHVLSLIPNELLFMILGSVVFERQ